MKARIIDVSELKKKPEEREAEQLLEQLTLGKAIELIPSGNETPRRLARLFRDAAKRVQKEIRVTTKDKGQKLIIVLKTVGEPRG